MKLTNKSRQTIAGNFYWLILGLLVFVALYPKLPLESVPGTYVAIRADDLAVALVAGLWCILFFPRLKQVLGQTVVQALLLFWIIGGVGVMVGSLFTHSLSLHLGLLHWMRRIEYMSLFLVPMTSIKSVVQVKRIWFGLMVVSLIVIFYGFGQVWLRFPVISTTNREYSKGMILSLTGATRVNSTFAGQYDLAAFLSVILIFLGSLFFYYSGLLKKLGVVISGGLGVLLLGLTESRISFAAAIVGLMSVFYLCGKRLLMLAVVLLAVGVLIAVPNFRHRIVDTLTVNVLGGGGPKYNPPPGAINIFTPLDRIPVSSRAAILAKALKESTSAASKSGVARDIAPGEPINSTALGVYRSLRIRLDVEWPKAIRGFEENPFLGTGYSSLTIVKNGALATDNDYLRSLGETGVLGTASLALIFFILIKELYRYLKETSAEFNKYFITAALCSVVAILITTLFVDVLEASKIAEIFWILMGVSWALMRGFKDAEES